MGYLSISVYHPSSFWVSKTNQCNHTRLSLLFSACATMLECENESCIVDSVGSDINFYLYKPSDGRSLLFRKWPDSVHISPDGEAAWKEHLDLSGCWHVCACRMTLMNKKLQAFTLPVHTRFPLTCQLPNHESDPKRRASERLDSRSGLCHVVESNECLQYWDLIVICLFYVFSIYVLNID